MLRNFESFSWLESVLPLPYPDTLKIVALNVGKTRNNSVYVEDEMRRAARTMVEKPVFYGVSHNPEDKCVVGNVAWAEYEDGRLECVVTVDNATYALVKAGEIEKCSVETRYIYPERIDGIVPHGLIFDGLLLVPKGVAVGDPDTSVSTLNRLYETIVEQETVSQSHRRIDGGESIEKMGNETNPPSAGGQSGSASHLGEGNVLIKRQVDEAVDKRLQSLNETLQSLRKTVETLTVSFESFKAQNEPEILVQKTRETLAKEFALETRPAGKGIVSDETCSGGISEFSDLLRPDPSGKGGQ